MKSAPVSGKLKAGHGRINPFFSRPDSTLRLSLCTTGLLDRFQEILLQLLSLRGQFVILRAGINVPEKSYLIFKRFA